MRSKLGRAFRWIARKIDPVKLTYRQPDPMLEAVAKQTVAIKGVADMLKPKGGHAVPDVVNSVAAAIVGPQIVRSIADTRAMGVPDSEILDTLVERLAEAWW